MRLVGQFLQNLLFTVCQRSFCREDVQIERLRVGVATYWTNSGRIGIWKRKGPADFSAKPLFFIMVPRDRIGLPTRGFSMEKASFRLQLNQPLAVFALFVCVCRSQKYCETLAKNCHAKRTDRIPTSWHFSDITSGSDPFINFTTHGSIHSLMNYQPDCRDVSYFSVGLGSQGESNSR